MPSITVRRLYKDNQAKLRLTWIAGTTGSDNILTTDKGRSTALVGHLNFIHPNQVQVLGTTEVDYLNKMEAGQIKASFDELFDRVISLVIVANNLSVPSLLRDYCHTHNVPLMTSGLESPYLMDVLRIYLQRRLAVSTVMHGVFLDVFEVGVLIVGQSGLGKSELALELISRGHGLVADDAIELYRIAPERLEARCPAILRDFLEVRGLGILNVRTVFGELAVRPKKLLQLIIHLVYATDEHMQSLDRLNTYKETEEILDVHIRKVTLPVAAGRNLAVLVEAAVQNYILQLRGIDSTKDFIERQTAVLKEQEADDAFDSD
ncbi:HPr(Ser) kinase/phosphatase [Neisseria sp. Ec49-e6-T10]|uniref:HPr(Ser) kinase/phosphatase n=1 Tax=Neisseria sp. Ec49-e6-T10 TaxID=3140744 RepID=UPI003EB70343